MAQRIMLLIGLLLVCINLQAQRVTSLMNLHDSIAVNNAIGAYSGSEMLNSRGVGYFVNENFEQRQYRQWSVAEIPDNAEILSISINILFSVNPEQFRCRLYYMNHHITNLLSGDSLWMHSNGDDTIATFNMDHEYHIGGTVVLNDPVICDLVKRSLLSDTLTLGFRSNYPSYLSKDWGVQFIRLSITYLAGDPIPVTITNYVNGQDYSGTGSLVRSSNDYFHAPPITAQWREGGDYAAETWFYKYDIQGENSYKFDNWNDNVTKYKVQNDIANFDDITMGHEYLALTTPIKAATIKSTFEGLGDSSTVIQFWDPWRVEQNLSDSSQTQLNNFAEKTTPYEPKYDATSYGVFLNKAPNPLNLSSPYYHILPYPVLDPVSRMPKTTGALLPGDWVFTSFSTDPQKAMIQNDTLPGAIDGEHSVVFLQDDAIIEARYKQHLYARNVTSGYPTANNNQRRVSYYIEGIHHAVFESDGEIYHIQSTNKGQTWTPERRLSDGSGTAYNPSITCYQLNYTVSPDPYFVFMQGNTIRLQQLHNDTLKQLWSKSINPGSLPATPVVSSNWACGDMQLVVLWNGASDVHMAFLADRGHLGTHKYQENFVVMIDDTILFAGYPSYPNITGMSISASASKHLTWRKGEKIYYLRIYEQDCHDIYLTFSGISEVNNAKIDRAIGEPSVSQGIIAFEMWNYWVALPLQVFCMPRLRTASGLVSAPFPQYSLINRKAVSVYNVGTLAQWKSISKTFPLPTIPYPSIYPPLAPSVGTVEPGVDTVRTIYVAYNHPLTQWGGRIDVGKISGSGRDSIFSIQTDGVYPNLVEMVRPENASKMIEVYSNPQGSNSILSTTASGLSKSAEISEPYRTREIYVMKDTALTRFCILLAAVGNVKGEYGRIIPDPCSDTLEISDNNPLTNFMKYESFTPELGDSLLVDYSSFAEYSAYLEGEEGFELQLRNAANDSLVFSQTFYCTDMNHDSLGVERLKMDLSDFEESEIYLTMDYHNKTGDEFIHMKDIYYPASGVEKHFVAPSNITPYSPVTILDIYPHPALNELRVVYSLEKESMISVSIYDMLGRRVRMIDNIESSKGRNKPV